MTWVGTMTDRDISRIWWRLLVPFAVLVFCAVLPNKWAAELPPIVFDGRNMLATASENATAQTVDSVVIRKAADSRDEIVARNLAPLQRRTDVPFLANLGRKVAMPLAAIADELTTAAGESRGCVEAGAVKNRIVRIVVKLVVMGVVWALVEFSDGSYDWLPWVAAAAWGGAALHNSKVKC